jgi:hypothetical protein
MLAITKLSTEQKLGVSILPAKVLASMKAGDPTTLGLQAGL